MSKVSTGKVSDYSERGINTARRDAILQHAGKSILDVGCGSGAYVLALADRYDIRGIDFQEFPSWQKAPDRFGISDASKLEIPDQSVDTILSFETLEHLDEPDAALGEYFRVCRKNLILTIPNCEHTPGMVKSRLLYWHWLDRSHVNFYTPKEILVAVEKAGFSVKTTYLINRINLGPAVAELFGLPTRLNKLVKWIFKLLQRNPHYITVLVVAEKCPESSL